MQLALLGLRVVGSYCFPLGWRRHDHVLGSRACGGFYAINGFLRYPCECMRAVALRKVQNESFDFGSACDAAAHISIRRELAT